MSKSILKRFAKDEKGAAYIMAAFALVPLLGMAGLAVDYSNAVRTETALNTAAQSVALHLAKRTTMNPNIPAADLIEEGKGLMAAMVGERQMDYVNFFVDPMDGMVQIEATIDVKTYLMQVFGHDELTVRTRTQAQFGRRNVEVAIAIDNSGSMSRRSSGVRMIDAAKTASKALMDAASDAMDDFQNADLKFSVVPWHTNVRVPEEYREDEWWIDWDGRSTGHFNYLAPYNDDGGMYFEMRATNGDQWRYYQPVRLKDYLPLEAGGNGVDIDRLRNLPGINIITRRDVFDRLNNVEWAGCFEHRHGDYQFSFDPVTLDDGDSLFVPYMAPDERDNRPNRPNRNSYISDLGGDTNTQGEIVRTNSEFDLVMNAAKYAGGPTNTTGGLGPNGKCNTAPMIGLTDDRDDLEDAIDGMQANGNTDLTIGLSWAMNTLTPWEPFDQAVPFDEAEKVMVFMTDGDNWPRYPDEYRESYSSFQYPKDGIVNDDRPWDPNRNQANAAFDIASKEYCTQIKSLGVRIYFVYFGNPSRAATEIMNHCATSPETAIAAANSTELIEAFEKIGDDIGKLRLTHYNPS